MKAVYDGLFEVDSAMTPSRARRNRENRMAKAPAGGAAVLSISHDLRSQLERSHRIAELENGTITQVGTPDELLEHPGAVVISKIRASGGLRVLRAFSGPP